MFRKDVSAVPHGVSCVKREQVIVHVCLAALARLPLLVTLFLPQLHLARDPLGGLILPDVTVAVGLFSRQKGRGDGELALFHLLDLQLRGLLLKLGVVGALLSLAAGKLLGFLTAKLVSSRKRASPVRCCA